MLETVDLDLLLHRRTDPFLGRKLLLMGKELDNTVILIMTGKLSLSDTLLERMVLGSLRDLIFQKEQMG